MYVSKCAKPLIAASLCLVMSRPAIGSVSAHAQVARYAGPTTPPSQIVAGMPQALGGPDAFGYTWSNSVPFTWVDARSGINSGLNGHYQQSSPITLPFSFKYYDNTYNVIYISTNGTLQFFGYYGSSDPYSQQLKIPLRDEVNDIIAPHWQYMDASTGGIYYLSGGTAPNRWWVAEWYQMGDSDPSSRYTFEAVLFENGDIEYRFLTMSYGAYHSAGVGIENHAGTDGLQYSNGVKVPNNTVVHLSRPAPAARADFDPPLAGAFATPNSSVTFHQYIENYGDLGVDTFDLLPISAWPVLFFDDWSGVTMPLTDTNGNGIPDTGPLAPGVSRRIVISVTVPANAMPGQSNNGQLFARSARDPSKGRTMPLRVAVPVPFVQSYWSSSFNQPPTTAIELFQPGNKWGYGTSYGGANDENEEPVVATRPDGVTVQAWAGSTHNNQGQPISEIWSLLIPRHGFPTSYPTRLTNNHAVLTPTEDYAPSVAVAPNGNMAFVWFSSQVDANHGLQINNVYYTLQDANGSVVVPPTRLTNNTQWISARSHDGGGQYYKTTIAATANNRFFIGWHDMNSTPTSWYTVRDSSGGVVKAVSQFGTDACTRFPNFQSLADGTVFVSQQRECGPIDHIGNGGNIWTGRMDSAGNLINAMASLTPDKNNDEPDAAQLPSGNIVLAWHHFDGSLYNIRYVVLDSTLNVIKGITELPRTSPDGDAHVSVTYSGNQAVLTWADFSWGWTLESTNYLYHTLLDANGNITLAPMAFLVGYPLGLPANGQANTYMIADTVPPTNPTSLWSSSHAVGAWSTNNVVNTSWSGAADDDSGLDGYSIVWDHAPATLPPATKTLEENINGAASPALADGLWYFHICALDYGGNWAPTAANAGPFKVDRTPPTSAAQSPAFAAGPFAVNWSGSDAGSGIASYDIWVRDGHAGAWNVWLNNTPATGAVYAGVTGHTYDFRSQAHDAAGNVETDLPANGDTHTTRAAYQVSGNVMNLRGEPIFNAHVTVNPPPLNSATSDRYGNYALYFATSGTFTLTANRQGYGVLPSRLAVPVTISLSGENFVLPPTNDAVTNGEFESGNLTGWTLGADVTAISETSAAHSGRSGLRLVGAGVVSSSLRSPLQVAVCVTQSLFISRELAHPTLSWWYRVVQGGSGEAIIAVRSISGTLDYLLPPGTTPGDWLHVWLNMAGFRDQSVELALCSQSSIIDMDDISIGDSATGVYLRYMPVVRR